MIEETRPLSRDKRWKIVKLIEAAKKTKQSPAEEINPEVIE
jgi:hypothetical protein